MEVYTSLVDYLKGRPIGKNRGVCGRCELCGTWHPVLEKDHKVPRHLGGTDDAENIEYICPNCHSIKTAKERQARFRSRTGSNNPMFGKHLSTERKEQLREMMSGPIGQRVRATRKSNQSVNADR